MTHELETAVNSTTVGESSRSTFDPCAFRSAIDSCQLVLACLLGTAAFFLRDKSEWIWSSRRLVDKIVAASNVFVTVVAIVRIAWLIALHGAATNLQAPIVPVVSWILATILSSWTNSKDTLRQRRALLLSFYAASVGLQSALVILTIVHRDDPLSRNLTENLAAEVILVGLHLVGSLGALVFTSIAPWWEEIVDFFSLDGGSDDGEKDDDNEEELRRNKIKALGLKGTIVKCAQLAKFVWPNENRPLRLRIVVCLCLLTFGRAANYYLPQLNKLIVDSLSQVPLTFAWHLIVVHFALQIAKSQIRCIQSILWQPVQSWTSLEVEIKLHEHIHGLPLSWHLSRKTGQVTKVVSRGKSSVHDLLNHMLFFVLPTLADMLLSLVYFLSAFNGWFILIISVSVVTYAAITFYMTALRNKHSRKANKDDDKISAIGVDGLLNFETVKYFNAEKYEVKRYRELLVSQTKTEWAIWAVWLLSDSLQSIIRQSCVLATSLLCAHMIVRGENGLTVGDYSLFATVVANLINPLDSLSYIYKYCYFATREKSLVDMESMVELLATESDVKDPENGREFTVKDGRIEFRNVCFHYKAERPILKNIAFTVEPGKTLALVGPTGSGKSTICRLLFRFYDPVEGAVLFDSQDVSTVTQESLRQCIGVVPQDTVLFNESIRYNIRYGKLGSSDEEVERAAQAAEIHEHILAFPKGYNTLVGERGLRLSGGEKQRVAIARTILKGAKFLVLDEATSSLDSNTERQIQASLDNASRGRTTVVVAHRLSTIVSADEILVLKDGAVIERGRHKDLLEIDGLYASMWLQQLKNETCASALADEDRTASTDVKPM